MEQLPALLRANQSSDNAERKGAEAAIVALCKQPACVPALAELSGSAAQPAERMLAAIVLRKRAPTHWDALPPHVRSAVQARLLQAVFCETECAGASRLRASAVAQPPPASAPPQRGRPPVDVLHRRRRGEAGGRGVAGAAAGAEAGHAGAWSFVARRARCGAPHIALSAARHATAPRLPAKRFLLVAAFAHRAFPFPATTFLFPLKQSPDAAHRQLSLDLFVSLCESVWPLLAPHVSPLCGACFCSAIHL